MPGSLVGDHEEDSSIAPPPRHSDARFSLRSFLATESAGGALIALATLVALVWANSPWSAGYRTLWAKRLAVHVVGQGLTLDLRHWVADGAMTVFFLVVGLEIKRELTHGHLADRRAALVPVVGAVGGMAVPALVYLAIAGRSAPRGWAVPMATDIALAVGLLAVVGRHLPPARRTFLLTLAIADDIGAIVVIAVAYGGHVRLLGLLVVAVALAGAAIVVRVVERELVELVALAVALAVAWLGLRHAGVHPTLAGVAVGLIAPARRRDVGESLLERCERVLHPLSGYLVVPVFALAHAGVTLSASALRSAAGSAITWGVVAGLVLGKPVGIVLAGQGAARWLGAGDPGPTRQSVGVGAAAGIGFTVALFITELAFTAAPAREAATIGVLAASVLASVLAAVVLRPWRTRG